ncbi:MAG: hypothetical protein H6729_06490 [Deltaproteobacteria bacterium]|nr:hypothetical protein [Deltaproteobacteria bacterium]
MRDRHLWRIGFDLAYVDGPVGTPPRAPNRSELPEPRWDEYRRLFRTLGIERGATRESEEEGAEAIYLPTKIAPRGAVDSEEKGFVIYGPRPPDPLFTSLDSPPPPAYYAIAIYAPLKDHWYLYRRYNE